MRNKKIINRNIFNTYYYDLFQNTKEDKDVDFSTLMDFINDIEDEKIYFFEVMSSQDYYPGFKLIYNDKNIKVQDEGGPGDEGAPDGHTLLLAAGELAGQVAAALLQVQDRQQFLQIPFVRLPVVQQHRKDDVLFHGQLRDQVEALEDKADVPAAEHRELFLLHGKGVLAIDQHFTGGGRVQRPHHIQQRTLARTGLAYHGDILPLGNGEADIFQRVDSGFPLTVGLGERLDF